MNGRTSNRERGGTLNKGTSNRELPTRNAIDHMIADYMIADIGYLGGSTRPKSVPNTERP